jgi:hypothetical protein
VTGIAAVVDTLRPRLRAFRDEGGRELFDLPDASRPDPDTPAPTRFLPEYDNVLLGHADRSRVIEPGTRPPGWAGNLLHDGFVRASWKIAATKKETRIEVKPFSRFSKKALDDVIAEGNRLLRRVAPESSSEIQLTNPG